MPIFDCLQNKFQQLRRPLTLLLLLHLLSDTTTTPLTPADELLSTEVPDIGSKADQCDCVTDAFDFCKQQS